jgi:monoamine oxidase
MHESRREYLMHHRSARAWAALDRATNDQMKVTYDPYVIQRDSLNRKHVVIIGSGVGGLTTAYELLAHNSNIDVTILEARDRTGGRCLTLRTGDTLTEDKNSDLYSASADTQVVRFERPVGDSEPYLLPDHAIAA